MKKTLLLLLAAIFPIGAFAQMVTPSIDPVIPTELAAANAWRIGSTFGGTGHFYYQEKDASNDAVSAKPVAASGMFAYQPGNFVAEFHYLSETQKTDDIDGSSTTWQSSNKTEYSINLAIRGNRQVSVGVGYIGQQDEIDINSEKGVYSLSAFEGSFSMRMFDGLFFWGAGMQRITEAVDISDDTLKYNKVLGGAAFHLGDPTETLFRVEGGFELIPETDSESGALDNKPKTTITQATVELMALNFLLSYNIQQSVAAEEFFDKDVINTDVRYGLGYKYGGLTFSFYRNASKTEFKYDDSMIEYDNYQITIGYSFL